MLKKNVKNNYRKIGIKKKWRERWYGSTKA